MRPIFSPNLADLKKKVFTEIETVFLLTFRWSPKKKKKKRSSSKLNPSSSARYHIRFLTNSHRHSYLGGGGLFLFSVEKSASKVQKTGYFAYSPGQCWLKCPKLKCSTGLSQGAYIACLHVHFWNQFSVVVPEFCWVTHKKGSELRFWIRNCVWLSKIQELELRTGSQKCTCKQANCQRKTKPLHSDGDRQLRADKILYLHAG